MKIVRDIILRTEIAWDYRERTRVRREINPLGAGYKSIKRMSFASTVVHVACAIPGHQLTIDF